MALLDYIYLDSGLTDQLDDSNESVIIQAVNGSSGTTVFYVGTTTSGNKLQANSNPGIDQITVGISDSAGGTGVDELDIKLATTEGGLASATAGATINIGTTIPYGTPQSVWVQWDNSTGSGDYTEISLDINAIVELAI